MEQQGNMNEGVTDIANTTILSSPSTPDPVCTPSFSEASTAISTDALPNVDSLSLDESDSTTNAPATLMEDEAPIVTDSEPKKGNKSKLSLNRAAIIAKAQAAKNDRVFAAPSAAAKRSARLKTPNYKPILAAGKGSLTQHEQLRKELAEKMAKKKEEADARAKQGKTRQFLDYQAKKLLQDLPDEAVEELPDNFYQLAMEEKLSVLLEAHMKYRREGKAKGQESGRILGEIEKLEEFQDIERSIRDSKEHEECICDECKESQGDVGGVGRIVGKMDVPSE
ncbi:hypothetical protein P171DRAFT_495284 [Karstenula rhodostoma CBS 690.94]|uniref:Uncharacterized protein n=1 Tax=Karstenula rhodostoma CBS 690.94 TaxID=1392251 RepID=A0A9P4U9K0_9PLEO|nr:hypothetical protein P171DRAFT_495284 [Karstenula rhodostoma CBS 690.94]